MNPTCTKCSKTVYPMEKMSVLDKFWHKACFKCDVCDLTLTMKNYKGYNKKPYCTAHFPTTKHTVVADTPENKRLAQQTKQQSQLEYHKKFEEEKGQFTAVTDDPETLRIKKNKENISNVKYSSSSAADRLGLSARSAGSQQMPEHSHQGSPPHGPPPGVAGGPRYKAVYDYNAADDDEVSFSEGDIIVEVTVIDDGWMEGRVQRTGQHGMVPSNYVELV